MSNISVKSNCLDKSCVVSLVFYTFGSRIGDLVPHLETFASPMEMTGSPYSYTNHFDIINQLNSSTYE